MFAATNLPDKLALFPLSGALLLPRTRLPLHIFEPRYLAMLDDTLKTPHRLIGMIQPMEHSSEEKLHMVGCAGRVTSFTETDDGRYMVSLSGVSRFRLTGEVEGFAPYKQGEVDWREFSRDLGVAEKDPGFDRKPFLKSLSRFFESEGLSTDWESLEEAEDEMLLNSLAMLCPFEPEDKQALLEAGSLPGRRKILETLIEFALRGGSGEEMMQ